MPWMPTRPVRDLITSAEAILNQAEAIIAEAGDHPTDLSGVGARINLINQSVFMMQTQLVIARGADQ